MQYVSQNVMRLRILYCSSNNSHKRENSYACNMCFKTFSELSLLNYPHRTHTKDNAKMSKPNFKLRYNNSSLNSPHFLEELLDIFTCQ